MSRVGFRGHVLEVNLTSGRLEDTSPNDDEWRTYVGGGLMGVRRLLTDTRPGLDAFDPEALLMFWSSAVAGLPFVGLARCAVVAKSPLTGGVGEARAEGPFGLALKAAGFEGIVITGRSEHPTYLVIDERVASIHDARHLWGMNTAEATDAIQNTHGTHAHVAAIGPSGERLVRFANIITDRTHPAARMGLGAVMGAKNLKAVVVMGGVAPTCADPALLAEITEGYRRRMASNVLTESQYSSPGFGAWIANASTMTGYVGGFNYSTSAQPLLPQLSEEAFRSLVRQGEDNCPGCPNHCIKTFANDLDDRAGGLHEEALGAFALGLGITSMGTLLNLNAACHLWGVDPVSLAFVVSFVCEVGQHGLVQSRDLGGSVPTFGDEDRLAELLEAVALRSEGVEWLSEGVRRASEHLGPATSAYAMAVKGLEMVSFDPRASAGQALAYAVSPLGPRYEIVEHDIDFDPIDGYPHGVDQMGALGFPTWEPMAELNLRRVLRTSMLLDMWSGLDALCVSLFAGPPVRELRLPDVARLVGAVTGWNTSDYEIFLWGRRRWQLMRVYNLREGLSADDDCLPRRFHDEPIDAGRHSGAVLDEPNFRQRVSEYYEAVGWDAKGRPTVSTLTGLNLEWAIGI